MKKFMRFICTTLAAALVLGIATPTWAAESQEIKVVVPKEEVIKLNQLDKKINEAEYNKGWTFIEFLEEAMVPLYYGADTYKMKTIEKMSIQNKANSGEVEEAYIENQLFGSRDFEGGMHIRTVLREAADSLTDVKVAANGEFYEYDGDVLERDAQSGQWYYADGNVFSDFALNSYVNNYELLESFLDPEGLARLGRYVTFGENVVFNGVTCKTAAFTLTEKDILKEYSFPTGGNKYAVGFMHRDNMKNSKINISLTFYVSDETGILVGQTAVADIYIPVEYERESYVMTGTFVSETSMYDFGVPVTVPSGIFVD